VAVCAAWLVAGVAPAAGEPLRVGSELDYAPFALVTDDGLPTGFSVELFEAVADVMGLDYIMTVGPWSQVLGDLKAGRLDVLPFVGILPERKETLDFSVPVVSTRGAAFVHTDGPSVTDEADLADLRVAVMRDDVGDHYIRETGLVAQVEAFPTLDAAFDCVASLQCDAVVAPRLQGILLTQRRGLQDVIQPADLTLQGFGLEYAFAVRKGNADLLATLNGGLALVIADGTMEQLYRKWLPPVAPERGIPIHVLMPYATGALALVLLGLTALYLRQRRATRLAAARGERLEQQAEHLRALAGRLEEERLRAESARTEADALIRVMPDLFFRFDADDRCVACHDPDGIALAPFEELRGKRVDEVVPEDVAESLGQAIDQVRRTGEVQTIDYALTLPQLGARTFEAKLAPFEDGGFLAVVRDVTEARAREQQLSRAAMAIASASAAKSRFLSTLSHELRTPLNAMMGFTEVLAQEVFGPHANDRYRDYARDAHRAGQSLKSLIDDLMDIERFETGRLTLSESVIDLPALVAGKVDLMRPLADRHQTALEMAPARAVRLWADEALVSRMVVHLLSNAVKFTEAGTIEVRLEQAHDGGLAVVVADTGCGMSADLVAHLGEPFYQNRPSIARAAAGAGLGVTLVKEMISLHGGALVFDSAEGRGTTARLVFPDWRCLTDDVLSGPGLDRQGA
jgi:signal transduction histidine kinase/ABC-type amino acid transport substrate-binding protein